VQDKLKVALFCGYSKNFGNPTYRDWLMHYLSNNKNIDLNVIAFGKEKKAIERDNLKIHVIKQPRLFLAPFFLPRVIRTIKHKLEEIAPDILHAYGSFIPYSTLVSFFRSYPSILTVIGIKAIENKYQSKRLVNLINILNERYVISRIPNIIVESSDNKGVLSKMTKSKIYVVPSGIEFSKIQSIEPHPVGKPDILFVGRISVEKGVDVLIKAMPILLGCLDSINLYIMGTGPQEEALKKLVKKLNLENYIQFIGFVSEEEKFQYYKSCKIVVIPSRFDFSPVTIYEAMACGKPVVASDNTNSEILVEGKNGLLFRSNDVNDLASKLLILLKDDQLRQRMGNEALEEAAECDWSKIAQRIVGVYREVAADFQNRQCEKVRR